MDILYIFPRTTADPVERTVEHQRRQRILQAAVSSGTSVHLRELTESPPAIESARDAYVVAPKIIAMAEELEDDYDAMIVGCFGDPAVDGAIEGTRLPIVGCALPSIALSLLLGQRFAVLSPSANAASEVRTMAMRNGVIDRFAGAIPIGLGVREFASDPEETLQKATETSRKALDLGADVLILGCLSLAFAGIDNELERELDVPVINPMRAALGTAELLVNAGLSPSRRFAGRSANEKDVATTV